MADVLNTVTLEMRASVNEAAAPYDSAPWIVISRTQYDLWSAIPIQYRKWVTDHIEEMSDPEKAAVDAALLQAQLDTVVQQIDQQNDILRAFAKMIVIELNSHTNRTNALLDAIDAANSLGALKTAAAAIQNLPTRTLAQLRQAIRNELGS